MLQDALEAWDMTVRARIILVFNDKCRDEPDIDKVIVLNMSKWLKRPTEFYMKHIKQYGGVDRDLNKTFQRIC